MKKISKWLALMLAACLCLSLCACGSNLGSNFDDDDDYGYDYTVSSVSNIRHTGSFSDLFPTQNETTQSYAPSTQVRPTQSIVIPTQTVRPTQSLSGGTFNVPALSQRSVAMKAATFKTVTGSITQRDEKDTYSYTPPRDGTYRFELTNIISGIAFNLAVYDSLGAQVRRYTNLDNNDGFVVEDMKGGQKYTVELQQYTNYGDYTLLIGEQTATVDVSAYSVIQDSTAFRDQSNYYTFTPTLDGRYHLEFAEVMSGIKFSLIVYDRLGAQMRRYTNLGNNDGITVDLQAGEQYTIEVAQYTELGSYQLKIGKQKATVNVTNYSGISDSIEFKDQRNCYTFVPKTTGDYRLAFANVKSGVKFYLHVYNHLGEIVYRQSNMGNNDGFAVELQAGETYTILVEQYYNLGSYTLKIN